MTYAERKHRENGVADPNYNPSGGLTGRNGMGGQCIFTGQGRERSAEGTLRQPEGPYDNGGGAFESHSRDSANHTTEVDRTEGYGSEPTKRDPFHPGTNQILREEMMKAKLWFTASALAGALGFLCIAASVFFIMGYVFAVPGLYTYPVKSTPVAMPSAILFLIIGIAIMVLAMTRVKPDSKRKK